MRIAMIGTRGVPARYGGFETAVEEVGARLVERGHQVVVYCRGKDRSPTYRGMTRVVLPLVPHRAAETLSHTCASVLHLAAHPADVALVFNAANAPLLPFVRARRIPLAVHVDGLEWKRAKWGPTGRRWYLMGERLSVRWADALIADACGIQDYYTKRYAAATTLIAYGAKIVETPRVDRLAELGLTDRGYHLVVARMEPENHVDVIVDGYVASAAALPLVVVGSVPYSGDHVRRIERTAAGDPRVSLVGGVWDQDLLDSLYAGAASYLHGHSVGGTNPSLLRAMGAGAAVTAFDVDFNREVLQHTGLYFHDAASAAAAVEAVEAAPEATLKRGRLAREEAARRYRWDDVAAAYEELCVSLQAGRH